MNVDLIQKYEWALDRREQGLFTVPSTIGEEMKYNPFMRCDTDVIRKAVGAEVGDGEGVENVVNLCFHYNQNRL